MSFKKIKVRVIKSYIDKEDGRVRELNEEFTVSEKRFRELEQAGHYVEIVDEPDKTESKDSDTKKGRN